MAKAFINDENLTDIADAIRATLDESRQYLPSEMAAAIQSIPIMAQLNRKKCFQPVPAGAASGYATIEQIEGNTVVWNQLVDTGSTSVVVQSGHVYYATINGTASIATSDGTPISVIGGTDIIHDLTLIFGAGNEPSTVAEYEAWRDQNGLPSVADYNAGELLSVKMQSVKSVGFNQWDEEIVTGGYYDNNGTWQSLAGIISDANGIRVFPDTNYFVHLGNTGSGMAVTEWDASGNFIRRITSIQNTIITTSSNAHTLHFNTYAAYGSTYNHDICINLSDPSKNGTYEPYQSDSADIDVTTITGINTSTNVRETIFPNGMKQADREGTVKDELDLRNDTATVKCGIVDLGSLNYTWSSGYSLFMSDEIPNTTGTLNILSTRYVPAERQSSSAQSSGADRTIMLRNDGKLSIKDIDCGSNPNTLKNTVNGVYAIYELATPIVYTDLQDANGNPLNPRYKVEHGGTEQVLPVNTSTPTTVAPTLTTTYTKDVH